LAALGSLYQCLTSPRSSEAVVQQALFGGSQLNRENLIPPLIGGLWLSACAWPLPAVLWGFLGHALII
jgi:hypothetical protein